MTPLRTPFFGYHMPSFSFPGATNETRFEHLVSLACAAEEAGFDMVTVMDHFYQIPVHGFEEEPMLEAYATLSALAARTSRVRLATMVSFLRTIMSPVILVADQAHAEATLSRLSPEQRAQVKAATPAEAAEALQPYVDAGFGGLIFRNTTMLSPEAIGLAGELIRLMR